MTDTTEKFDTRRAIFLERLIRAWDKVPGQRLGQIIVESLEMVTPFDVLALRGIDDKDLMEKIERYVLTGPRAPLPPTSFPPNESPTKPGG
jgi:hypothetical protein